MKTTLNPFENAKRTAQGTGGGVSPAVIEEMQAEISILGSQNKTQAQDITDIKGSLNSINDNLTASNQTAGVSNIPFRFGCNDAGEFGYIINQGGADSVIPFRKDKDKVVVGTCHVTVSTPFSIDLGFEPKYLMFYFAFTVEGYDRGGTGVYFNDGTFTKKKCFAFGESSGNGVNDPNCLTVSGTTITLKASNQYREGDGYYVAIG